MSCGSVGSSWYVCVCVSANCCAGRQDQRSGSSELMEEHRQTVCFKHSDNSLSFGHQSLLVSFISLPPSHPSLSNPSFPQFTSIIYWSLSGSCWSLCKCTIQLLRMCLCNSFSYIFAYESILFVFGVLPTGQAVCSGRRQHNEWQRTLSIRPQQSLHVYTLQ